MRNEGAHAVADDEIDIRPGALRKAGADPHRASRDLDQAWRAFRPDARMKYTGKDA